LIDFSYYFKVGGIKSSWFPYFKRLNCEVSECGWKFINWLIERIPVVR
jgi:hypothetical protein